MEKRKVILGLKAPRYFSLEERKIIIEEYLRTSCSKREIWKKYTGQKEEHGHLLRWMRQLGYDMPSTRGKLADKNTSASMPKQKPNKSIENTQLQERITQLEKTLVQSELRATALETMIEVAEKELKINIKKKSFTKQSTK